MDMEVIRVRQLEDLKLLKASKDCVEDEHYSLKLWFINVNLLTDKRVYVPISLRQKLIEWFHDLLRYSGTDGLYYTIAQHFYWKGIKKQLAEFTKTCSECQKYKITAQKKYGKFKV